MTLLNDALATFQAASGVSADKMSLFIRSILLAITLVWAGWCALGVIHSFRHSDVQDFDMGWHIMRIFLIVTAMTILVFV